MKRRVSRLAVLATVFMLALGCAGTVVVRQAPPAPKVEVKPARPGKKAVWIGGHWKWNGHRYVWSNGHWAKNPKGAWVPGHWAQRGRGHVWVKGHWQR